MSIFTIRIGNTSPALEYTLRPSTIDLADAVVRFHMVKSDGTVTIDNQLDGVTFETDEPVITYQWQEGDTDVAGRYEGEFRVTYEDGSLETFPARGFIAIMFEDRT